MSILRCWVCQHRPRPWYQLHLCNIHANNWLEFNPTIWVDDGGCWICVEFWLEHGTQDMIWLEGFWQFIHVYTSFHLELSQDSDGMELGPTKCPYKRNLLDYVSIVDEHPESTHPDIQKQTKTSGLRVRIYPSQWPERSWSALAEW